MNSKRKKIRRKPNRVVPATVESQSVSGPSPLPEVVQKPPFSKAAEQAFSNWMKQVFGTEDKALQSQLLHQASGAVPDFAGRETRSFDYVAAALHGIAPQDSLQGMLAVQM